MEKKIQKEENKMLGIGNITVNAEGKTPEEVKEEIMSKVAEQLDGMLELNKEEVKSPAYIHIRADEDKEKKGCGVHVEYDGDFGDVMTMLTIATSEALHNISEDSDDEYNPGLLLDFISALIAENTSGIFGQRAMEEKTDVK